VFTAALPVTAVAYAMLFLHETAMISHGIALLCVIAAIIFASEKSSHS
jgi:drug/metabolite transporter (DMT)-like permease